ncbi:hypothetical protein ABZ635_04215 [Nocardiopsis sp. NPDC007018]|uniref:hypothetical protein n=1 Tax=Nocardiopsis sp. NPDC007018 TaxID=3155721 RepID=UPI0033D1E2A2
MSTGAGFPGSAAGTSHGHLPGALSEGNRASSQADPSTPDHQEEPSHVAPPPSFSTLFPDLAQQEQKSEERSPDGDKDPYEGMSAKERKAAEKKARQLSGNFADYPFLLALKPKERYVFRSDYFQLDDRFACILGFFHDDGARDDFGAFWGINRIPVGLPDGVTVVVLEQVRRMGEKWIEEKVRTVEKLDRMEEGEQAQSGTMTSRRKSAKVSDDMEIVAGEIQDGASYLHVHNRLLVRGPSLEVLDDAVERIGRLYIDRFGTLKVAAYPGEQRQELTNLFGKNERKRGKGFHFTSVEFAGSHSLVTNGLNDPAGEYVGSMVGDVNNSAVLFNVNDYEHHVVVADGGVNPVLNRAHIPDMWGSKISQSALLANARTVHIILNGARMDELGPRLDRLTARLDMNSGDINMFEMFGKTEDELGIFPAHLEKVVLMAEQAYETTDSDRSIIRGSLKETLTQFYIDKGMWARNAKHNRDRLRVVGIPHTQVPRLQDIVSYFDTKYRALANSTARDDEMLHAYNILRLVFKDLLDNNGDLFNTHTNDEIDGVSEARRVLYDFSRLLKRGKGVAMAQLVNVIGFAVDNLSLGDTVIIHGAENIDDRIKEYLTEQFSHLFLRGGRVAYLYNDVDRMLADSKFNRFDAADWTILGQMRDATVTEYQRQLHQDIPPDLERLVTTRGENLAYLRRGHTNVVFHLDLPLGINPARAERRAQILGATRPGHEDGVKPEQSSAIVAAQGERAEERSQRVADQGAEARLDAELAEQRERLKPSRKRTRHSTPENQDQAFLSSSNPGRMNRGR